MASIPKEMPSLQRTRPHIKCKNRNFLAFMNIKNIGTPDGCPDIHILLMLCCPDSLRTAGRHLTAEMTYHLL